MDNFYRGKLVYITGGSSGIGLGLASELVKLDANVVLLARNEQKLQEAVDLLISIRPGDQSAARYISADVTDQAQLHAELNLAVANWGVPDVLITSAGMATAKSFTDHTLDDFRANLDSNVMGTVAVVHALVPHMVGAGGGTIAMIGSLGGLLPVWGYSAYSSSKASLTALAEVLRYELGPKGLKISLVCPPEVNTPMIAAEAATVPEQTRFIKDLVGTSAIEPVAKHSLKHIARGKPLIIRGFRGQLFYHSQRLFPGIYRFAVSLLLKARGN